MVYEDWMFNIIIASAGVIGTYAVLRSRVDRLEQDLQLHHERDSNTQREFEKKLNASFTKIDESMKRLTVLEQDTKTHLTMPVADEKFVNKIELQLHLEKIELQQIHLQEKMNKIEGNGEEILTILKTRNEI